MARSNLLFQGKVFSATAAGRSEVLSVESSGNLVLQPVVPVGETVQFNVLGSVVRADDASDVSFVSLHSGVLEEGDWFALVDVGLVGLVVEVVAVSLSVDFFVASR